MRESVPFLLGVQIFLGNLPPRLLVQTIQIVLIQPTEIGFDLGGVFCVFLSDFDMGTP